MPVSARWIAAGAIGLVLASGAAVAQTSAGAGAPATTPINAGPYVPTPTVIVSELLKMAEIKPGDFVIDLGSGDGRLVITAAKQGARGWGIDIQDVLVKLANENAEKEGVADRVKFVRGDLFEASVAEATVVTLYLLPTTVVKLIPKFLAELKPGTRVVSHDYPLAPWQHEKVAQFEFEEKVKISGTTRTVLYRYIIPAKLEGTWDVRLPPALAKGPARFTFTQDPTLKVRGTAFVNGRQLNFDDVTVRGEEFNARLQELAPGGDRVKLRGTVNGSTIRGSAEVDGKAQPWQATLRPR
jgi:protein-L-isoaspartate O-methyltransferase